jgi:CubicO group peptidase (beta-lactamase class C family)
MRHAAVLLLLAPLHALADEKPARLPDAAPSDVGLDAKRLALIDGAANDAIKAGNCPGAVVLVLRQGKVVHRKAYGLRAVLPKKEEMTADTAFDLASLTKPIATAAAVHLLIEKGKLKLSDPVARHLPAFGKHGKDKVTVEHLLLHVSGLPAGNPVSAYGEGLTKAVEKIGDLRPATGPGEKFVYSDLGYVVLGALVEKVSGEALDAFARKHLFEPLGLKTLTYRPDKALRARCAPTQEVKGEVLRGVVHDPRARALGGVAGHAGLFGTADDLAVFAQMLLDGGKSGKKQVLAAETVKRFTAAQAVPAGQRTPGWDAATAFSGCRGEVFGGYGHTGFTGTSIWIDPPSRTAVIILTNRVHPDGKGDVRKLRSRVATLAAQAIVEAPLPLPRKKR